MTRIIEQYTGFGDVNDNTRYIFSHIFAAKAAKVTTLTKAHHKLKLFASPVQLFLGFPHFKNFKFPSQFYFCFVDF